VYFILLKLLLLAITDYWFKNSEIEIDLFLPQSVSAETFYSFAFMNVLFFCIYER